MRKKLTALNIIISLGNLLLIAKFNVVNRTRMSFNKTQGLHTASLVLGETSGGTEVCLFRLYKFPTFTASIQIE